MSLARARLKRKLASLAGKIGAQRLSELLRRGAPARAERHEQEGGVERILRVTHACNQRCPFCFVPADGWKAEPDVLERELERLAPELGPQGVLTLSGGEPLVHPRLDGIIRSARRRGIAKFVLQTNGVGLERPGALEKLLALGVVGFDVSFHSHLPRVYDRLTGTRGQHPRAVSALSRLFALGAQVSVCVVITALNYRSLPAWAGFLGRLARGARPAPRLGFTMLNGAGVVRSPELAVDLALVAPYLRRAAARAAREGLLVPRSSGECDLPPCLASSPARFASQDALPQRLVRYANDFSGEKGDIGRAKRPACRRCAHDAKCLGVPAEYARMFGLGALHAR